MSERLELKQWQWKWGIGAPHTPPSVRSGPDLGGLPWEGGCWEGCGGLQPGEPAFLHQSPLRALPLAPSKQREITRRSLGTPGLRSHLL